LDIQPTKEEGMKRKVFVGIVICMLAGVIAAAHAAEYPDRPITLQVPTSPGGGTDVGARILASISEKIMGQPIVVINRSGAGNQVGLTELARQKPDGYYIGFAMMPNFNTIILNPERKAVFQLESFTPIINQVQDDGLIFVRSESPYKTLKDLLEDARKRPGEVRAATTGILGDDHLAILMMEQAAGVKFRIVHFADGTQQYTAVMGGQVDVGFENVGGVTDRIKGGVFRGLAMMSQERSKFLPEIRTTVELGYPTVIASSTRGVVGPKGLPDPVIKKLQEVFLQAMKSREHMEKMEKVGLAVKPMVGEEYAKFYRDIHERCKPLVEAVVKAK
jgi:tripartite-type tricarboxylate transporter receptor subunit TctC